MKSFNKNIFLGFLAGTGGFLTAYILLGLFTAVFFGIGYYLLTKYNRKGTKLFSDMEPIQYLGVILCIIGMLPYIQYFFMGFLSEAGSSVFDNLVNN